MNRRTLLTGLGASLLAGCSQVGRLSGGRDSDSQWPSNTTNSSPKKSQREWAGGHRDTSMTSGILVLDDVWVELGGANVAQQVGVSTSQSDKQNIENIPKSDFEWYSAPDNAFIWFVYLNFIDEDGGGFELPDPDLWTVRPIIEQDHAPVQSFTSSFDPDPTYYRLPGYTGSYTQPAYTNSNEVDLFRLMVFEIESDVIELLYGDPPEVTWNFNIE